MLALMRKSPYGRAHMDPTDQHWQRSWLVSKVRTDLAKKGIKLNARVLFRNVPVHEREHEGRWSLNTKTARLPA
jgi:hypothetical protein